MGSIPIEELLPPGPDEASEVGSWSPPPESSVMRVGFDRKSGGPIVFEGETPIRVQLCERIWRYRYPANNPVGKTENRWRLEILTDPGQAYLRPQHSVVIAQEPYGNGWLQAATFKMYSKEEKSEQHFEPVEQPLREKEDPVDWLERNLEYDPWENGAHYVAGIGAPNGFHEDPRNTHGAFVFGACPDFNGLVAELLGCHKIQDMLRQTEQNHITFWYRPAIKNPPQLYPEVIAEAETLMGLSIQQALAGPRRWSETWFGQEVSKLVRTIYCDHLNAFNKKVQRCKGHEGVLVDDHEVD